MVGFFSSLRGCGAFALRDLCFEMWFFFVVVLLSRGGEDVSLEDWGFYVREFLLLSIFFDIHLVLFHDFYDGGSSLEIRAVFFFWRVERTLGGNLLCFCLLSSIWPSWSMVPRPSQAAHQQHRTAGSAQGLLDLFFQGGFLGRAAEGEDSLRLLAGEKKRPLGKHCGDSRGVPRTVWEFPSVLLVPRRRGAWQR